MKTSQIKEEIFTLCKDVSYFESFNVIEETSNTIKIRLTVSNNCFVQIYINTKKRLKNYVLVFNGQRIYGCDNDGKKWHIHPWKNPSKHKNSKEINLKEFLFEVYNGLVERGIV
ncbi:hypothetical protein ACFL52_03035 [Candidatus Margulisiibacteriota bacterium]